MNAFSNEFIRLEARLRYYAMGVIGTLAPRAIFQGQRDRILASLANHEHGQEIIERVNYYNKLDKDNSAKPSTPTNRIDRSKSRYFLDLNQYLKYFPDQMNVDYLYGDIRNVPPVPTLLKSRPVGDNNNNSVLLNLDKLRHFGIQQDQLLWPEKVPKGVWRGRLNNPLRIELIRRYQGSTLCDVGYIEKDRPGFDTPKPFMTKKEQLGYRYIISVEGVDVATNLKWIMASNSVCLMPKPRFETWFMEGRLEPDRHFVLLKDDFSDLEEKIDQLESDPALRCRIVQNANDHVKSFTDKKRERLISLLVLQKYFEATGQMACSTYSDRFFAD